MEMISLPATRRQTTRLGFGCGSVMGVLGESDSLRMLETAFDAGIRHFDVAPAYGYGEAERCLGTFIARHPGQVTVTTKFGIPSASSTSWKSIARKLARPLLKAMPGLKGRLPGISSAVAHVDTAVSGPNPIFTADQARVSIESSLRTLQVDHIDLLLLHEARAIDLNDDAMLRLLEDMVVAGKIGSFGIGSEGSKIPALLASRPAYCRVLQYEWSAFDALPDHGDIFRLHHRSLTRHFASLHTVLLNDAARCNRLSEACGADISDSSVLASLMLKAAMLCNPNSIILFSSKRPANISGNAHIANSTAMDDQASRFYAALQAEQSNTPASA